MKRLINLEDFSVRHQKLICMFGHPHDRVPAAGRTIATGGTPAAIVPAGGGGGVPPVPVFHADYGPHINPLYVTMNEFNAFRALVNQSIQ